MPSHFQWHRASSFQSSQPGFPKGFSSDHHDFAETRKGAPTSWAGTPDALHLDLNTRFAKGILQKSHQNPSKTGTGCG
jgi:hypothetical protein